MIAEKDIQDAFIKTLQKQGYQYLGKNLKISDINDVFRQETNRLNSERFNGVNLSDTEFARLLLNMDKSMAETYSILRYGIELIRDDNTVVTVTLFDTHNHSNNTFQVTEELKVKGIHTRRLDVVLLVNGIPIVASELKKVGNRTGVAEAIKDINTYTKEGIYRVGLLKYVQIYVASNQTATKYFATSIATQHGEAYRKGFNWADSDNKRINHLVTVNGEVGFVETFLNPEMLTEVLIQYMLNIPAPRNEILILRPYQIYATRAGKQRLLETDGNGFFWHATGSGKTLTSYMLTKAVTEHPKFAKTVMLLDRNDLADQTIEEYGFFSNTDLQVDRGRKLLNAFVDPTQKTVTTTIQSFSRLLTKQAKALKGYTNEPVCFIVDECHRSTFGKMFQIIKETFPQAQFIGFTGTPLLAENANLKERTTKDIFGEPIHIYTIKNAIDDGNVLKFELHEVTIGVSNNSTIEKDSYYYSTPARHQQVASYLSTNIWKHTGHKTVNKKLNFHDGYTAMFATDSIKSAHNYWQLLTPLLEKQGRTTAIVFSVANKEYEEIEETTARDWFIEAVTHYDTTFGTNFRQLLKDDHNFSDVRKTYVSDVTRRVKNKEIDLVIVSDMLLTGFDAKTLNTIYLDKNLKHHNLLQAKSRTNRTYPRTNKQSGNVILFSDRNMVPAVNESIILYSNNLNVEGVIERRNYQQLYNTVVEQVRELKRLHPTPETIDAIEEIVDLKNVAQTYSALSNNLNRIQTYDEWETVDWPKTGVTEEEMEHYYSSIIEKKNQLGLLDPTENDDDQWEQLEFAITNITVVAIDIAYINNLLRNLVYAPPKQKMKAFDIAEKAIQVSTDPTVEQMKQILLELLSEHEKINSEEEMWELLEFKKVQKLKRKYREYSTELDIEETVLQKMVEMLQTNERYPEEYADNLLNQKNLNIIKKVPYRKKIETAVKELANYPLP